MDFAKELVQQVGGRYCREGEKKEGGGLRYNLYL